VKCMEVLSSFVPISLRTSRTEETRREENNAFSVDRGDEMYRRQLTAGLKLTTGFGSVDKREQRQKISCCRLFLVPERFPLRTELES
jgi:hypothetical protein